MTMIAIDRNVPMPPPKGGRFARYPWHSMEVGDSFFAALPDGSAIHTFQPSVSGMCIAMGKRLGCRFSTRRENGGVRVWRVA